MPQINRSLFVRYSTQQMYLLVNDISSYPDFLSGCTDSCILSSSDTEITASLKIHHAGISKFLVTRNQLINNRYISISLIDGPFKTLNGSWQFIKLGDDHSSRIQFFIDFEFSSIFLATIFNGVCKKLFFNILNQFLIRANAVYRKKKISSYY